MTDQHKGSLKSLSILSVEAIIRYMNPEKVFEVSVGSESFFKFVEIIKIPIEMIDVETEISTERSIRCTLFKRHYFTIECISPGKTIDEVITGRINGKPMTLQKAIGSEDHYYYTESFSLVEMEDITSHLLRIFKPISFFFGLDVSSANPDCFVWKMRPSIIKCYEIYFSCNSKNIITWENIRCVIEEAATYVTLKFESSRRGDGLDDDERKARNLEFHRQTTTSLLDIPKKIICEEFDCKGFDLISVDDLINSQCKRIILSYPEIPMTNSDLNKLLKAWQKGKHLTNLERLEILDFQKRPEHMQEIMEGIELHDEDPSHPTSMVNYRRGIDGGYYRGEDGVVIKRETDNALASIVIKIFEINVLIRKNIE